MRQSKQIFAHFNNTVQCNPMSCLVFPTLFRRMSRAQMLRLRWSSSVKGRNEMVLGISILCEMTRSSIRPEPHIIRDPRNQKASLQELSIAMSTSHWPEYHFTPANFVLWQNLETRRDDDQCYRAYLQKIRLSSPSLHHPRP